MKHLRLLPLALVCLSAGQLTPGERQGIVDALFIGNMATADLQYGRRPLYDAFRLPLAKLALEKPLDAADDLMALHSSGPTTVPALLAAARRLQGDTGGAQVIVILPGPGEPEEIP